MALIRQQRVSIGAQPISCAAALFSTSFPQPNFNITPRRRCKQRPVPRRRKVLCCRGWRVQPLWNICPACCHFFCRYLHRLGESALSVFSAYFTPRFRRWDNTVVLALTRPGQVTAATLEHHSVAIEGSISHGDKVAPAAHGRDGLADPKLAAKNNWGVVRRASIKPEIGACFSPTYFSSTQHPVHSPLVPTFSGENCLPSRIHRPEQSRRTARRQRAHPSQRIRRRFLHDLARSSHLAAGYFSHAGGCTCRCSGLLLLLLLLQCDTLYTTGDSLHEPLLGALEERSN